jgi:TonB-linked SusC/RagA family outer membrane protein
MTSIYTFSKRKFFRNYKLISITLLSIFMILLLPNNSYGQKKGSIKGTVVGKVDGKPIIGATVQVRANRKGDVTDKDGNFNFNVPPGEHKVEVSYIGYQSYSQNIIVNEDKTSELKIKLTINSVQSNQVIVTGLTGEVDRNKLGNNIARVDGKDITNIATNSAIDGLTGNVAGATVTKNSGTPGGGTYITLRGRKTISGSSEPLYVVDGVILDNTFIYDPSGTKQFGNRAVDINPQDIESIEILKGASAAALYGSLAGNGVVLITTKKGTMSTEERPARVSFNSSYQMDEKMGEVPLQTIYGQTTPYTVDPTTGIGKQGTTHSYGAKLPEGTQTFNNSNAPFRTGVAAEQSLSIAGGDANFDYLLNGTYLNNKGFVEGSELDRTSIRANIGALIMPGVTIQNNTNFINIDNALPQDGSNQSGILLGSLRAPANFDNSDYLEADGTQRRYAGYDNPIWSQKNNKYSNEVRRTLNSTVLKIMPYDWMSINTTLGIDKYDNTLIERLAVGSAASPSRGGAINQSRISNSQTNLDITVNLFDNDFIEGFSNSLIVGMQQIWYDRSQTSATSNTTLPFFDQIDAGSVRNSASSLLQYQIEGFFAQLTSTYNDKLTGTIALRRDGNTTFGSDKEGNQMSFYYPKGSISYQLSKEEFMRSLDGSVDNLRIRASYGEAGSPYLPFAYATNFLYVTDGIFDPWGRETFMNRNGFIGLRNSTAAGAAGILPEKSVEREVGMDMTLFGAIDIELSYYYTNIFDMILSTPVPSSTGYQTALKNAASMYNEGIEALIKFNLVSTEDLTWTSVINFTSNKNRVLTLDIPNEDPNVLKNISLTGGFSGMVNAASPGYSNGVFLGYGWLRDVDGKILHSGDKVRVEKDSKGKTIYIRDANGEELLDDYFGGDVKGAPIQDSRLQILGNSNPDFQLSWRNNFTISKDFTVSFLFDGVFGFDIWNGTRGALYNFGTHAETADRDELWFNDRGEAVMDVSDASNPVQLTRQTYYRNHSNGFFINEPFVEHVSYIKLREMNFAYTFREIDFLRNGSLTLSFAARNLFVISDYKGFDPEVNNFSNAEGRGYDYFTLPQVRSYRFGLSINY